jgi:pilus assembly protein CpaF
MEWRQQLRRNWDRRRLAGGRVQIGRTVFIKPLTNGVAHVSRRPGPRQKLRSELVEYILQQVDGGLDLGMVGEKGFRDRLMEVVDFRLNATGLGSLDAAERRALENDIMAEIQGLGPLDVLAQDHTVSDILVNGPGDIWVDRNGRLEKTDVQFDDDAHLLRLLMRLAATHGRHIEEASPYVDVRMADGSRLHAMIPPLTAVGPVLAIRRARAVPLQLGHLYAAGTMTREMGTFLAASIEAGLNILISGGASVGKTTLLNILAQFIPGRDRVVTIEETAELRLSHPHVVSLETRLPNSEGRGEVAMRTLVRNALRMRADRIVVGEVRGGEVFDMLQAMNLGHSGSLTTVHANNAEDSLRRLETLALLSGMDLPGRAVRELVGSAFHLVVHMVRQTDGARRIASISEVIRVDDSLQTGDIFVLEPSGLHVATGARPAFLERMEAVRPGVGNLLAPARRFRSVVGSVFHGNSTDKPL